MAKGAKKNLNKIAKEVAEESPPADPVKWDPMKPQYLQKAVLTRARNLYLQNYSFERIFLETEIPPTVYANRRRSWEKLKFELGQKVLIEIRKKAVEDQAKEFVEKGLHVGLRFLDSCIARESELTPKDFKLVMDSVMAIHRVKQLEIGEPTNIDMYKGMNPRELREYLKTMEAKILGKHGELLSEPNDDFSPDQMAASFIPPKDDLN